MDSRDTRRSRMDRRRWSSSQRYNSDSVRTELAGQDGIASLSKGVIMPDDNATLLITVSYDGLSALNRIGLGPDALKAMDTHLDMVSMLGTLWSTIPFHIAREHAYGHQDEGDRYLTVLESLDCKMDELAKSIAQIQTTFMLGVRFPPTTLGFRTIY